MNADCEAELAAWPSPYRRIPTIAARNRSLAPALLWLAAPGDGLVIEPPWPVDLISRAERSGVELVAPQDVSPDSSRRLEPWGWTPSVLEFGRRIGDGARAPSIDVVRKVSSKEFSHAIERELGSVLDGAAVVDSIEQLESALASACPGAGDKWVIKGPFGFAARERVLGRGPALDDRAGKWVARRLARGERLIFEPWLDVVREYGVPMWVGEDGAVEIAGFSDLQTNGAGAATGYWIGRRLEETVASELTRVALEVGARLSLAGYWGPAGIDALEHSGGLRPLVEINPRWTMGHVAVAASPALSPGTFFRP
ncbi:MAG: hypothetical protein IT175_05085 [Acidobacteria bacterium]|nr:hypothetical protein [Acidobacteriota bacterium]